MIPKAVVMLFVVALVMSFSATLASSPASRDFENNYEVTSERAFGGVVTRTPHTIAGIMYFTLKTANADLEVQLGPRNFLEKSGFKLNLGEMVTVVGVPSM